MSLLLIKETNKTVYFYIRWQKVQKGITNNKKMAKPAHVIFLLGLFGET